MGQNTGGQNTAGHNTSVKIPVVIIPYWTKYRTGQNTISDKIPYWTEYRTGQNTTHDLHLCIAIPQTAITMPNPHNKPNLIFGSCNGGVIMRRRVLG